LSRRVASVDVLWCEVSGLPLASSPTRPRPPLCMALFPYTTLFRSLRGRGRSRDRGAGAMALRVHQVRRQVVDHGKEDNVQRQRRDRKSTRLNSSHVAISYAVFCLKKKKKNISNKHPLSTVTVYL